MSRITPPPSLEQNYFTGIPVYSETPSFQQLESEIRERAYLLWEKFGWDAQQCWYTAEMALFGERCETAFNGLGYRIYVRENHEYIVKIITRNFAVRFISLCRPTTLCSAVKQRKCPDLK